MNKKLSVKYLIAALVAIIFFGLGAFWGVGVGSAQSDQTDDINTLLVHREYLAKELKTCIDNNKGFDGYNDTFDALRKENTTCKQYNADLAAENKTLWEKNAQLESGNYCVER